MVGTIRSPFSSGAGHLKQLFADAFDADLLVLFEDFFLLHRRLQDGEVKKRTSLKYGSSIIRQESSQANNSGPIHLKVFTILLPHDLPRRCRQGRRSNRPRQSPLSSSSPRAFSVALRLFASSFLSPPWSAHASRTSTLCGGQVNE